ncbi:MAG TPA: hypothetical protein VFB54_08750 [Burkholderiales bacterium]|nr:hypothetical protein [Burkholderiales bacterium]
MMFRISPARMRIACALLVSSIARAADQDAAPPPQPAAQQSPDRSQIERKLDSIGTLIEKSSAAKQIEASQVPTAREKREAARVLLGKAQAAFQKSDLAATSKLLDDAARQMFEAVRLAAPQQVTQDKARADFDARVESVKVLLEAQRRIAGEKNNGAAIESARKVEQQIKSANDLAAAGKLDQARAAIDQAYLDAKVSIGGMRTGDTLVHTLTFANKEEEYRYELDRNDTHQMLIKVLLDEKRQTGSLDRMIQGFQDKAAELRKQAEAQAAKKDFEGAIRLLEQSTTELVRAIRGAGVYIPG